MWKPRAECERSKSGNMYCSRSCANTTNNRIYKQGVNHPNYKGLYTSYRKIALRTYPNKCCVCGYNEDVRILEAHHIDGNRKNTDIENLCLLCPTCHRKITLGYYKLLPNKSLAPIDT